MNDDHIADRGGEDVGAENPAGSLADRSESPAEGVSLGEYRQRLETLRRRLDTPANADDRVPLRDDLVELVRDIDASIVSLREMREAMKPLAERYREQYLRPAPEVRKVVDHLGASTFRERGWSALSAAAYEEAVGHLEAALERDPGELSAMAMLAWGYLRLDRPEEADDVLRRALAIDPRHPLSRTIAGLAHIESGRLEPAVELLRTVTDEDSSSDRTARMYAHLYLGVALARTGRRAEGKESIRRAIELGPNLTEAFWELGRIHAAEGEHDQAMDVWRAGAENRFSGWGERCRAEVERVEDAATEAAPSEGGESMGSEAGTS